MSRARLPNPATDVLPFKMSERLECALRFINRWARHDTTCGSQLGEAVCDCGYNKAVEAFAYVNTGAPLSEHPLKKETVMVVAGRTLPV